MKHFPASVVTGVSSVQAERAEKPELEPAAPPISAPVSTPPSIPEDEASLRALLLAQLETHRGNVTDVSRALGKTRMQILRWMKRFAIDPETFRA